MGRSRHPNKHIERAVQYAESLGWRFRPGTPHSHTWGILMCPLAERDGHKFSVYCTPKNPENHANHIVREVDGCPHGAGSPTPRPTPPSERRGRDDEQGRGDEQAEKGRS